MNSLPAAMRAVEIGAYGGPEVDLGEILRRRLTLTGSALRRRVLAVAVASCFAVTPVFADTLPIDPTVVSGSASFNQQGANLYVTNTPSAIINWGSFSIGSQNLVQFLQQYASSAVLNRVIGQDPSQILGSLLSNGRVFIINPNGITFGAGSTVDVAGLVASSLDMSNAEMISISVPTRISALSTKL